MIFKYFLNSVVPAGAFSYLKIALSGVLSTPRQVTFPQGLCFTSKMHFLEFSSTPRQVSFPQGLFCTSKLHFLGFSSTPRQVTFPQGLFFTSKLHFLGFSSTPRQVSFPQGLFYLKNALSGIFKYSASQVKRPPLGSGGGWIQAVMRLITPPPTLT